MFKRVMILESGLGFGGALTSLKSFLDTVDSKDGYKFYVFTSYEQNYLQKKGCIKEVRYLPRRKLYGPNSYFQCLISPIFKRKAGNIAFLTDSITTGLYYTLKVAYLVKKLKIDLIHCNNGTLINDFGIIGAKLARVPVIVHVRGPEYKSKITKWLSKYVKHYIAVSNFIKKTILDIGVDSGKIDIVYEGLDLKKFRQNANGFLFRKQFKIPLNETVIGIIACFVPWKGIEIFIQACNKVFKEINALALIVGDTPDRSETSYKRYLLNLVKDLNLNSKIIFTGHQNDIASAIDACDIIVHASTSPEPFGRVIIESMSLKKPVIATNIGGPSEIIRNEINGLLVPPSNVDALVNSILELINYRNFRYKIASRASKFVTEHFDIYYHKKNIFNVYSKVI